MNQTKSICKGRVQSRACPQLQRVCGAAGRLCCSQELCQILPSARPALRGAQALHQPWPKVVVSSAWAVDTKKSFKKEARREKHRRKMLVSILQLHPRPAGSRSAALCVPTPSFSILLWLKSQLRKQVVNQPPESSPQAKHAHALTRWRWVLL